MARNGYKKVDSIFDKIEADIEEQEEVLEDFGTVEHDIIEAY